MSTSDSFHVDNMNQVGEGDVIQQYGSGNIGKQVHTGPGDNVMHKPGAAGQEAPRLVTVQDGDYVSRDKPVTHLGDIHHDLQ